MKLGDAFNVVWRKIMELDKKIDDIFKYIKDRDNDKDRELICRYRMYLTSNLEYVTHDFIDESQALFKVSETLCEIGAFLKFGPWDIYPEEMTEIKKRFGELNEAYCERYLKVNGVFSPCYFEWRELAEEVK